LWLLLLLLLPLPFSDVATFFISAAFEPGIDNRNNSNNNKPSAFPDD